MTDLENLSASDRNGLVRSEIALEILNEWADNLKDGSDDVLEIIEKKIEELHKRIKYLRLFGSKNKINQPLNTN